MIISKDILGHIKTQLQLLPEGQVVIEIVETSNKLDVVTRKVNCIGKGERPIPDDFMSALKEEINNVRFGKVLIQVEAGSAELTLVTESRKRFDNPLKRGKNYKKG